MGAVIHEIFHALGREHKQSRPDRDLHVEVNEANIRSGYHNKHVLMVASYSIHLFMMTIVHAELHKAFYCIHQSCRHCQVSLRQGEG